MNFTHYDGPDGRKYVRVSRILSILHDSGLAGWRELVGTQEANRRVNEAADWGTEVHEVTAKLDREEEVEIPERSLGMVLAYLEWKEEWVEETVAIERTFFSKKWGFACTVDRLNRIKRLPKLIIVDLKTGVIDKKRFALQMSFYKIAVEEELGIETGDPIILPFDKALESGELKRILPMRDTGEREVCLALLKVYRWMTGEKWEE